MSIFRKQDRRNRSLWASIYYSNHTAADVQSKIEAGGDVNAVYKDEYYSRTMLHWAIDRNDAEVIRLLLDKGAAPNQGAPHDAPLMGAVNHRNLMAVRALLDAGAEVDVKSYNDETPLIAAAKNGLEDIVKALVERGADVNAQLRSGNTALHLAAEQGHASIALYLMEKGANAARTNGNLNTAADVAEKSFPGLAAQIRGKAQPGQPKPAEIDPGWRLLAGEEVAHVAVKDAVGYRVTEIFNFAARTYTHIASNLETKAESQSIKSFSELDNAEYLDRAYRELVRLGGKAEFGDAGKKKLPAPGM
ncbi:MAG: ankyrin repeat domain-containing protein [Alphaproteobacteria bacterium]